MILGYKAQSGNDDGYWFGRVPSADGAAHDRKFIRVFAGLILPKIERQSAAVAVFGELYRSFDTPDFTLLAATVDQWPVVKAAVIKLHQDLKYSHIIAENEQAKEQIWRIPEVRSVIQYAAPADALTETGRQTAAGLKLSGRLHYDHLKDTLERDPEQSAKAMQCALLWALEWKALYRTNKQRQANTGGWLGMEGLE